MNNKSKYRINYKQLFYSAGFVFSAFLFSHYAGKLFLA